jgi:hypothetical protein
MKWTLITIFCLSVFTCCKKENEIVIKNHQELFSTEELLYKKWEFVKAVDYLGNAVDVNDSIWDIEETSIFKQSKGGYYIVTQPFHLNYDKKSFEFTATIHSSGGVPMQYDFTYQIRKLTEDSLHATFGNTLIFRAID